MKEDLRVGEFEQLVLLAILRLGGNAYGITIVDEIQERTGRKVSLGAAYTTLARLEDKGFVGSRVGDPTPERGGRAKRFYRVQAPGLRALASASAQREKMRAGVAVPESV